MCYMLYAACKPGIENYEKDMNKPKTEKNHSVLAIAFRERTDFKIILLQLD